MNLILTQLAQFGQKESLKNVLIWKTFVDKSLFNFLISLNMF